MKLTGREKYELFGEGVITVILLLLLNLSVFILIDSALKSNPALSNAVFMVKNSITIGGVQIWSYQKIFILIMFLADVGVLYWRLERRYKQMQLRHIIAELHYIANGHFDHRIPFELSGDHQRVVDSVNSLVDSVISSMEEERALKQSKDDLITNVSHDLRTPLTSIIGYLRLIEDRQFKNEDDILKYTHTAYLKSIQMKSLVEDLFEYTKVSQSNPHLTINTINVDSMLQQLAASFELEAKQKHFVITSQCTPKDLEITGDAEKIGRVFNNLITNALKYGNGGKNIFLSAKQINDTVIFEVANDGEKVPAEALGKLFDRFYRVEGSRSKATGGTGLGLAIAQSIVEMHNGTIEAHSNDKRTSFVIQLPLHQPVSKDLP
ncbi:sensor histidine kinase [Pediococcus pentosaceus]|jgi:signal transduction histidine kinase|uniref:histidine kinase n=1 Tax=Pediococcus pentosaceus TaxID=1255 RepID=A0ABD7X4S2_PEDPE|nr:HAMP domain-containing sensor histidine kinase [Pediococcus pentosaceus]AXR44158.1 two-component sensor histidine kinase [Pediococcus pentosaceus]KAF0519410.1 GHKL domain-containing protein [Pediococcus pentosaceus]MBF7111217.1 HAMP domain-containing histidine kinase [Pediococcus pentosaceus]MBF7116451.1 HAMP domain-containing histidine kinase [Pediococcus pentosaceus]MBF7118190.1 HAMP domain-containing histidine kinase [Pediococcus pentosaceus]